MRPGLFAAVLLTSALGGACFAQGAPAAAPTGAAPANAAAGAVASPPRKGVYDPDVVICKWTEELGTRLGSHKTCMTRGQWDQQSRDSQDQLNDSVQRGHEGAPPGA
ncbi:MAG TPA: hypothetical protein VHZ26_06410 [Caulobacteraceae bacterium]|jgi:hypothetical protein|nr:hypothetical protein [Caulobacteraceae bacterium]